MCARVEETSHKSPRGRCHGESAQPSCAMIQDVAAPIRAREPKKKPGGGEREGGRQGGKQSYTHVQRSKKKMFGSLYISISSRMIV